MKVQRAVLLGLCIFVDKVIENSDCNINKNSGYKNQSGKQKWKALNVEKLKTAEKVLKHVRMREKVTRQRGFSSETMLVPQRVGCKGPGGCGGWESTAVHPEPGAL